MMRLLLVASDPMEFPGILAKAVYTRQESLPLDWARSAKLGVHDVMLAANGVGWNRAAAAVDAAAGFRPEAVISTGFCGALEDDAQIADIVVGTSVSQRTAGKREVKYSAGHVECPLALGRHPQIGVRVGKVYSIDHVARTSQEKGSLRSSGGIAVEMEAAGVAERAQALGLPFLCVKAVTDLAGETLSNDFNTALRSDGHFDTMLILRSSLRHPFVRLPELVRLRNRCVRAARTLGEFFADCRF